MAGTIVTREGSREEHGASHLTKAIASCGNDRSHFCVDGTREFDQTLTRDLRTFFKKSSTSSWELSLKLSFAYFAI